MHLLVFSDIQTDGCEWLMSVQNATREPFLKFGLHVLGRSVLAEKICNRSATWIK